VADRDTDPVLVERPFVGPTAGTEEFVNGKGAVSLALAVAVLGTVASEPVGSNVLVDDSDPGFPEETGILLLPDGPVSDVLGSGNMVEPLRPGEVFMFAGPDVGTEELVTGNGAVVVTGPEDTGM
jgi:hypothetical protein